VKSLPPRGYRLPLIVAFSTSASSSSLSSEWTGYFTWEYWWWNTETFPVIIVFGYITFFAIAAWVYDMGDDPGASCASSARSPAIDLALARRPRAGRLACRASSSSS
jgi:hypothetical protein